MPRRPAAPWSTGLRTVLLALALLPGAAARGDDLCQAEKKDWDRALEVAGKAQTALEKHDSDTLAPLVPGQADKERQRLQDRFDAAWEDVMRTMAAHDRCVSKKTCKKPNLRWACVSNWDPKRCCMDGKEEKGKDAAKGK